MAPKLQPKHLRPGAWNVNAGPWSLPKTADQTPAAKHQPPFDRRLGLVAWSVVSIYPLQEPGVLKPDKGSDYAHGIKGGNA